MLPLPRLLLTLPACLLVWTGGGLPASAFPSTPADFLERLSKSRFHPTGQQLTDANLETVLNAVFFHPEPASETLTGQIPGLVQSLGADSYRTREEASASLHTLGPVVIPALRIIQPHPDPEIRFRLRQAIQRLESVDLDFSALDYPLIAERLEEVLETGLADRQRLLLAQGIALRRDRGSTHRRHHVLVVPLIRAVLAGDDDPVINTLRPALDAADLKFAFGTARALNPTESLPRIPALLLDALRHPNPDLVAHLLLNRIRPPDDDPLRNQLQSVLRDLLAPERALPDGPRLNVVATLFYHYQDPLAAKAFASLQGDDQAPLITEALATPLLVGVPLDGEFIEILAPLRLSPHPDIRDAAITFLLQRTQAEFVRLGISSLNGLEDPDLDRFCSDAKQLFTRDLLRAELQTASSAATADSLPNNAASLLELIPSGNSLSAPFGKSEMPLEFKFR